MVRRSATLPTTIQCPTVDLEWDERIVVYALEQIERERPIGYRDGRPLVWDHDTPPSQTPWASR